MHEQRHNLKLKHLPSKTSQLSDKVILPKNTLSSGRSVINTQRVNSTKGPISYCVHSSGSPETCLNHETQVSKSFHLRFQLVTENQFTPCLYELALRRLPIRAPASSLGSLKTQRAGGCAGGDVLPLCWGPPALHGHGEQAGSGLLTQKPLREVLIPALEDGRVLQKPSAKSN